MGEKAVFILLLTGSLKNWKYLFNNEKNIHNLAIFFLFFMVKLMDYWIVAAETPLLTCALSYKTRASHSF